MIANYQKNCLHEKIRKILEKLFSGFAMEDQLYCSDPESKDTLELIEVSSCLNHNMAQWGTCIDQISDKFELIKLTPVNLQMAHVCWYVGLFNMSMCS